MKKSIGIMTITLVLLEFGNASFDFDHQPKSFRDNGDGQSSQESFKSDNKRDMRTVLLLLPVKNIKEHDVRKDREIEELKKVSARSRQIRCELPNVLRNPRRITTETFPGEHFFVPRSITADENGQRSSKDSKNNFRLDSEKNARPFFDAFLKSISTKRDDENLTNFLYPRAQDRVILMNKETTKSMDKKPKKYVCYCIEEDEDDSVPTKKPSYAYPAKRKVRLDIPVKHTYSDNKNLGKAPRLVKLEGIENEKQRPNYYPEGIFTESSRKKQTGFQYLKDRPFNKERPLTTSHCVSETKMIGQPTRIGLPIGDDGSQLKKNFYRNDNKRRFGQKSQSVIRQKVSRLESSVPEIVTSLNGLPNLHDYLNVEQTSYDHYKPVPIGPNLVYPAPYVIYPQYSQYPTHSMYDNGLTSDQHAASDQFAGRPFTEQGGSMCDESYMATPFGRNFISIDECVKVYGKDACIVTSTSALSHDHLKDADKYQEHDDWTIGSQHQEERARYETPEASMSETTKCVPDHFNTDVLVTHYKKPEINEDNEQNYGGTLQHGAKFSTVYQESTTPQYNAKFPDSATMDNEYLGQKQGTKIDDICDHVNTKNLLTRPRIESSLHNEDPDESDEYFEALKEFGLNYIAEKLDKPTESNRFSTEKNIGITRQDEHDQEVTRHYEDTTSQNFVTKMQESYDNYVVGIPAASHTGKASGDEREIIMDYDQNVPSSTNLYYTTISERPEQTFDSKIAGTTISHSQLIGSAQSDPATYLSESKIRDDHTVMKSLGYRTTSMPRTKETFATSTMTNKVGKTSSLSPGESDVEKEENGPLMQYHTTQLSREFSNYKTYDEKPNSDENIVGKYYSGVEILDSTTKQSPQVTRPTTMSTNANIGRGYVKRINENIIDQSHLNNPNSATIIHPSSLQPINYEQKKVDESAMLGTDLDFNEDDDENLSEYDANDILPTESAAIRDAVKKVLKDLMSGNSSSREVEESIDRADTHERTPSARTPLEVLSRLLSLPQVRSLVLADAKNAFSELGDLAQAGFSLAHMTDQIMESMFDSVLPELLPVLKGRNNEPLSSERTKIPGDKVTNYLEDIIETPGIGIEAAKIPLIQGIIIRAVENTLRKEEESVDRDVIQNKLNKIIARADNNQTTKKPLPPEPLPKILERKETKKSSKNLPTIPVKERIYKDGEWKERDTTVGDRSKYSKPGILSSATSRVDDNFLSSNLKYETATNTANEFYSTSASMNYASLSDTEGIVGVELTTDYQRTGDVDGMDESLPVTSKSKIEDQEDENVPIKYYSPSNRILAYKKNLESSQEMAFTTSTPFTTVTEFINGKDSATEKFDEATKVWQYSDSMADVTTKISVAREKNLAKSPNLQEIGKEQVGDPRQINVKSDAAHSSLMGPTNYPTADYDPSYFGKITMNSVNPNNGKLSDLTNTDLFYVGDGVKIPLKITRMPDGSWGLSISEKICESFVQRKCPCCVPNKGEIVEETTLLNGNPNENYSTETTTNNYDSLDPAKNSAYITEPKKRHNRSPSMKNSVITSRTPVENFAKKYNLKLDLADDLEHSSIDNQLWQLEAAEYEVQRADGESDLPKSRELTFDNSEEFIDGPSYIEDLPENERAEVLANVLDGFVNSPSAESHNLILNPDSLNDNNDYDVNAMTDEMMESNLQTDNPILRRMEFIRQKQAERGEYRYQRTIDHQIKERMNVLKNVLRWFREVFLDSTANDET